MSLVRKLRVAIIGGIATALFIVGAIIPSGAAATFSEFYGGGSICGSNCFIQSAGTHTFALNEGWTEGGSPALACQLFNSKGINEVSHGGGFCDIAYFGGQFVTARVYNQSGASHVVNGFAET
jgi:hypothetical protein